MDSKYKGICVAFGNIGRGQGPSTQDCLKEKIPRRCYTTEQLNYEGNIKQQVRSDHVYVGMVESTAAFIPALGHRVICKLMNRPTVPSETVAQMPRTDETDASAMNQVGMQPSCC